MVNTRKKQPAKKAKTTTSNARKPPAKPQTMPEPPPSLSARFLNTQACDRFKEIKTYRVIQERAFNLPKLIGNPKINQIIQLRGWETLNDMIIEQANKTVTLEFYANAQFSGKMYESYMRGKTIDYNPTRIN